MSFQAYLDTIDDKSGLTPRQLAKLADERGLADPSVKPGSADLEADLAGRLFLVHPYVGHVRMSWPAP